MDFLLAKQYSDVMPAMRLPTSGSRFAERIPMRISNSLPTLFLLAWVGLPSVFGQERGPRIHMETLRTTATVKGVRPRLLHVAAEDGKEWLVSVPTNYENVVFQATAAPDWLQKRMPVRFHANVTMEKHKKEIVIREPLTELTVATIRADVGMGIFPENGIDQREDLFRGGKTGVDKKPAGQAEESPCLIIGLLVENKDGKLRVAAGRIPVRAELDPKAEISVELHDVQWVRPGDKAEITARYLAGRQGQAEGQQITVTAAKPLSADEEPEKGRRRSARGRKSDDPKKEVDLQKDKES